LQTLILFIISNLASRFMVFR